jgi:hypothetical protein
MKRDDDRSTGEHAGDCHGPDGAKDMCVAGAIANFTSQLLHYKHGSADRKCKQTKILISSLNQSFFCLYLFVFFQVPTTFLFAMLADNLTEALLFLSHFMGDVHQVSNPAACFFFLSIHHAANSLGIPCSRCMSGSRATKAVTP